jgi:hypothetical protein
MKKSTVIVFLAAWAYLLLVYWLGGNEIGRNPPFQFFMLASPLVSALISLVTTMGD